MFCSTKALLFNEYVCRKAISKFTKLKQHVVFVKKKCLKLFLSSTKYKLDSEL